MRPCRPGCATQLDLPTRQELRARLQPLIETETLDPQGFDKPFAALVLSELARSDRVEPWLNYRGFDARRHHVQGFLQSVYVNSRDSQNPRLAALAPIAMEHLNAMN